MGRQRPLSFHGFDRSGRDKDKEKEREREKEKEKEKDPGNPPATPSSESSIHSEQTKGTAPQLTPPQQDDRKSTKSKNSSFVDLSQSLLGRFAPSSGSSHSTEGSPTDNRNKQKKEKESVLERKPSRREKIKRFMFGKRGGSDGGSILQSTISAEDLSHDEYILPSNTSLDSPGTRDVDLRSRPSADSLTSAVEVSKPKMQAREEKSLLFMRRSREELGHRRSHSGLAYLVDVDSSDEGDKKDAALADVRSPKRKPRVMGSMESMIPVPKGRAGPTGGAGLGTILSASPSANITPVTGTPKSQSPVPSISPTKNSHSRPTVKSPTSNKAKVMKYGSLNDEANATIRPRLKTRKPSAPLARVGIDDADGSVRARSNSLPVLASSEESSDSGSSSSEDAPLPIMSPSVEEEISLQQDGLVSGNGEKVEEHEQDLQADETSDALPLEEVTQHPEMTPPEDIPLLSSLTSPETTGDIPSLNTELSEPSLLSEVILLPESPAASQPPTLNRKPSLVQQHIDKFNQLQAPSHVNGKRGSFESTRSNTSSGWTTDEDMQEGSTASCMATSSLDTVDISKEEELRQQEKIERTYKEVHQLFDETEQQQVGSLEEVEQLVGREEVVDHTEINKDHQGKEFQEETSPMSILNSPISSAPEENSTQGIPTPPKSEVREVPVESLDNVIKEVETESLDNHLSPRLIPLPSACEQELIASDEGQYDDHDGDDDGDDGGDDDDDDMEGSVIFEPTKVAGSILLDSPANSSVYEHPISRRKSQCVDTDVVSEPEDIVSEPEDVVSEHEDIVPEPEINDTETEEDDEEDAVKVEKLDKRVLVDGNNKGIDINKRNIVRSTTTQTDFLPTLPPAPETGAETSQATVMESAGNANLAKHWGGRLSDGQGMEIWNWLAENLERAPEELQRRIRGLGNSGMQSNSISGVGADGEQKTESSGITSVVSPLRPANSASTITGFADASPTSTTGRSAKEVFIVNHQVSYVGAANWAYWLKILVLFVVVFLLSLRWYYSIENHHLNECGYAPEFRCACLPETVHGVKLFGKGQCFCVFWPTFC